jgi:predicted nucleic acid-binding Zn finger protein
VPLPIFPSLKCHLFEPSKKSIWTIVGKHYEYWIDLDLGYCSCNDYYFRTLSGKGMCYHLNFAKQKINSTVDTICFSDLEYYDFVKSVINDNYLIIRNEIND